MTLNSLFPAFVRIDYSTAYGVHSMTLPTVDVEPTTPGGNIYQFILRGAALPAQVDSAVEDFVNTIKVFWPSSTVFNSYTLFTMADPEATPQPVESNILNIAGTNAVTSYSKAVQYTWTWRTDEFGIFKLVFLDCPSANTFEKITSLAPASADEAVSNYVTADVTFLAGRDGGRPNTFLQIAKTLNEKLRRSYRMN